MSITPYSMATLERALEIAIIHHGGQKEKNGTPYAFHPIRLSLTLDTEAEKITALLHDIVEDTNLTLDDLTDEGFSPEVLEAVDLLTHNPQEDYETYIDKIATNPLARAVKLADLADNMDIRRLPAPIGEKDMQRLRRYGVAYGKLSAAA